MKKVISLLIAVTTMLSISTTGALASEPTNDEKPNYETFYVEIDFAEAFARNEHIGQGSRSTVPISGSVSFSIEGGNVSGKVNYTVQAVTSPSLMIIYVSSASIDPKITLNTNVYNGIKRARVTSYQITSSTIVRFNIAMDVCLASGANVGYWVERTGSVVKPFAVP